MPCWQVMMVPIVLGLNVATCKSRPEQSRTHAETSEEFFESTIETLWRRTGGEVPATLESFLTRLESELPDNETSKIAIALVPKGRSLQKDHVSFAEPRVIGAPLMETEKLTWPQLDLAMKIFFAYSDRARQLELISWTPSSNQFDFFIIENMKSEAPVFKKVDAKVCTVCHQHRGPLLQTLPWPDTNLIRGFVRTKLMETHGRGGKYLGLPIHPEDPNAYLGDLPQLINLANTELVKTGNMCNTLCAEDTLCLRLLAKQQFNLNKPEETQSLRATIEKNWPEDHFAQPNPALPVAIPGYSPELGIFESSEFIDKNTEKTALASLRLDPRIPRAKVSLFSSQAMQTERIDDFLDSGICFKFTAQDLKTLKLYPEDQIELAVSGETFRKFIDTAPPQDLNSFGLMRGILISLGTPENEIPSRYFFAHRHKNDASNKAALQKIHGGPAEFAFSHFCGGCHAKGEIATELPLRNQGAMAAYVSEGFNGKSIGELLKSGIMPPLTPDERMAIGLDNATMNKMLAWLTLP